MEGYGRVMQMERGMKPKKRPKGIASTSETMRLEDVGVENVGEVRTYRAR
jgi:hypothetical protein